MLSTSIYIFLILYFKETIGGRNCTALSVPLPSRMMAHSGLTGISLFPTLPDRPSMLVAFSSTSCSLERSASGASGCLVESPAPLTDDRLVLRTAQSNSRGCRFQF